MAMNSTGPSPPPLLQRIRNWLRSDMLVLRWVFLVLYVVIVTFLFVLPWNDGADRLFLLVFGILTFGCQALFIFGGGTMHLCRPIRKRRLWMPVLVAAMMFSVLAGGLFLALGELFFLWDLLPGLDNGAFQVLFCGILIANWLLWFLVFFLATRRWQRMRGLGRITGALIVGSLAELLAAVPSHMIVSRRPGCLVGMWTACGIAAGLLVMLFAFGPAIALLFLRPRYRQEQIEGPQEPELQWYQFSLRKMFLAMFVVSVGSSLVGVGLQRARERRSAAAEIYKVQAGIEGLGGSVSLAYQDYPDSLDELFGDPGVFYIGSVEAPEDFGDAGMKHLRALPHLEQLCLTNTQVTDAGLIHLKGLASLGELDLSGCDNLTRIPDLSGLTNLTSLDLSGCANLTDVSGLAELTNLMWLDLSGCDNLTDVPDLSKLTSLTWLNLNECDKITDVSALSGLSELTSLTNLYLNGCGNLTDVSDLAELANLTALQLRSCEKITKAQVEALQEKLPNCKISH